mmetsp:Transcript_88718/g.266896  ORF Transcript_88718/g.266896 Transcript_88718/m.266896 type:complete len:83 (+) Transcript_88718:187-435(+)
MVSMSSTTYQAPYFSDIRCLQDQIIANVFRCVEMNRYGFDPSFVRCAWVVHRPLVDDASFACCEKTVYCSTRFGCLLRKLCK